jgi:hypothetical protein
VNPLPDYPESYLENYRPSAVSNSLSTTCITAPRC